MNSYDKTTNTVSETANVTSSSDVSTTTDTISSGGNDVNATTNNNAGTAPAVIETPSDLTNVSVAGNDVSEQVEPVTPDTSVDVNSSSSVATTNVEPTVPLPDDSDPLTELLTEIEPLGICYKNREPYAGFRMRNDYTVKEFSLSDLVGCSYRNHVPNEALAKAIEKHGQVELANKLMAAAREKGKFDPNNVKKGGVHSIDEKTIAVNTGSKVRILTADPDSGEIVSDKTKDFDACGKHNVIYEGDDIDYNNLIGKKSASIEDVRLLLKTLCMFSWAAPVDALFVLAWTLQGVVGGALKWCSHLYLLGATSSGKSTIVELVIQKILDMAGITFKPETTPAGFRTAMESRSNATIFEEFDSVNGRSSKEQKSIMFALRDASTSVKGNTSHGSSAHIAYHSKLHCPACLSGTHDLLIEDTDRNRYYMAISRQPMNDPQAILAFDESLKPFIEAMTPEFRMRIRTLVVKKFFVIQKNIAVFRRLIILAHGGPRKADTDGTLLGFAYLTKDFGLVDEASAKAWLEEIGYDVEQLSVEETDEYKCASIIMHAQVKTSSNKQGKAELDSLSVKECIETIRNEATSEVTREDIREGLGRIGLKVDLDKNVLVVANSSDKLGHIMGKHGHFNNNWANTLIRIPNASKTKSSTSFGKHHKDSRAVMIPLGWYK